MFIHIFSLIFYKKNIITPDISYGCEIGPPVFKEEQSLKVLENGMMREIFS
jgi:hypothetical protein